MPAIIPTLAAVSHGGVTVWTDVGLRSERGVVVAFSERHGGVSTAPFESLNLAAHVGDDPSAVDENRRRLVAALGIEDLRSRMTFAEQVHGDHIGLVGEADAGAGARAAAGREPVRGTDALVTRTAGAPLVLCFADCVPVVLVAPGPAVAVVHAGWRGALASLPGRTVEVLCREAGCSAGEVLAYVGPHIGACHYEVGYEILSQFVNAFGNLARADSGSLDLDAVVSASLDDAGVASCNIARLGTCTAETTDRFFSHRAEGGHTGRHAALTCVL